MFGASYRQLALPSEIRVLGAMVFPRSLVFSTVCYGNVAARL
jgi:hypothetical protein